MDEIKIKSNKGVKAGTKRGAYKKKTFLNDSELAIENAALKERIEQLKASNNIPNSMNDELVEILKSENQKLKSEISLCKVNAPAFIFDPVEHKVFADMNRVIAFGVKSGNLDKRSTNLPQKFTASAIKYYLKNEFNHILK
jgi:hypothetical protein